MPDLASLLPVELRERHTSFRSCSVTCEQALLVLSECGLNLCSCTPPGGLAVKLSLCGCHGLKTLGKEHRWSTETQFPHRTHHSSLQHRQQASSAANSAVSVWYKG